MIPCLSQITTFTPPLTASLEIYARSGWSAVELWLTTMDTLIESGEDPEAAATAFQRLQLAPVAASGQGGLFALPGPQREASWSLFRKRLAWMRILGVPVLVLSPDFPPKPSGEDLSRAASSLVEAAGVAAEFGVRIALEPQRGAAFCASLDTTLAFLAHADAPGTGVCLDLFHFYTGPSKSEDLSLLSSENLLHVQVCDLSGVPRELATDADRILPGEGDLGVEAILRLLSQQAGYQGPVSVELLNPQLRRMPVDQVSYFARQSLDRVLSGLAAADNQPGGTEP